MPYLYWFLFSGIENTVNSPNGSQRSPRFLAIGARVSTDEGLDSSDDDTYSNYTDDDSDIEEELLEINSRTRSRSASVINDENRIPETDPGVITSMYRHITQRGRQTRSKSRELSMDRSINESNHSYNLRVRNTPTSPSTNLPTILESPTQFAKDMKASQRNRRQQERASMNYFSSDDE